MPKRKAAKGLLQLWRCALFCLVVLLIHLQYAKQQEDTAQGADANADKQLTDVQELFPNAAKLQSAKFNEIDCFEVLDAEAEFVCFAAFTLPRTSDVLGFSGPTDVLVIFDRQGKVVRAAIVGSADTRDHVDAVREDPSFLSQLAGKPVMDLGTLAIDGVSGATLTSLAILESLRLRFMALDSGPPKFAFTSLRFPEQIETEQLSDYFPDAVEVRANEATGLYEVLNQRNEVEGLLLRISPAADNIVGYQGPTDAVVVLSLDRQVLGLLVGKSYDNEPYTEYVAEDRYFKGLFNNQTISELANLDLMNVEGVSGATMTSQAVAAGIANAAQRYAKLAQQRDEYQSEPKSSTSNTLLDVKLRDVSTVVITVLASLIGLTKLKRKKLLRAVFQFVLVGWLGLVNGDMISQALWLGWAQHGIAWQKSLGLLALSAAAVCLPILSGQNVYCAHICPHGALQQLTRNRLPWRLKLGSRTVRLLKMLPFALLIIIVAVGMLNLAVNVVDLEPFDAWIWSVAGTSSVLIAFSGLAFSLFVPMGYCRFGCPTGAILNGLRRTGSSWSTRDTAASVLAIVSVAAFLLN